MAIFTADIPLCKTCQRIAYTNHECPPAWRVWNPDDGETREDASIIYAHEGEDAASDWGEKDDSDSAEYRIARGKPVIVNVQRQPDGPVERYKVTGYYDPVYIAEPVKD